MSSNPPPDPAFADRDLAALYDLWHPPGERADFAFYHPMIMAARAVLDVGCGTGAMLHRARDAGHAGRLCGLDPAAGMLVQARAISISSKTLAKESFLSNCALTLGPSDIKLNKPIRNLELLYTLSRRWIKMVQPVYVVDPPSGEDLAKLCYFLPALIGTGFICVAIWGEVIAHPVIKILIIGAIIGLIGTILTWRPIRLLYACGTAVFFSVIIWHAAPDLLWRIFLVAVAVGVWILIVGNVEAELGGGFLQFGDD